MGMFARAATKELAFGGTGTFNQGPGTLAVGSHVIQFGGSKSATGVAVTTDSALGYSPFWSGARILAETVAQVPLVVMRQTPSGGKERAKDHPLYPILHDKPNPRLTSFRWREQGMLHECTWGNHYAGIARDGRGRVRELWPLSPDRMAVTSDSAGELLYDYTSVRGETKQFKRDQILHIPALAWDGTVGLSPIRYHRESIGLGLATAEHGARFFSNGVNSNFVLATDGTLSDKAIGHLRDSIDHDKKGLQNAWDPWILEEGVKPFLLSMPNDDAQWLETRKHQVLEIARVLRIPPYKLGVTEPGAVSFKSVEQYAIDFVVDSIVPWVVRWEQDLGMQLLGSDWTGVGGEYFVTFVLDALLRGDTSERYAAYHFAIADGWLTRAEARDKEDLNAIDGLDAPLIPLNVTTVAPDGTTTRTELGDPTVAKGLSVTSVVTKMAEQSDRMAAAIGASVASLGKAIVDRPIAVHVAPPPVTFAEGAIHVETHAAPISVPPSTTTIEEGAVVVHPPAVTVNVPEQKRVVRRIVRDGKVTAEMHEEPA